MPRHDQVRVSRDDDDRRVDAPARELVELLEEHLRVDDAACADHRRLAGDHAARRLADLERLAFDDDRVPGVRAALVAADDVALLGQQVDDLALAFVAPLGPDDHGRGHWQEVSCTAASDRRASSRATRRTTIRWPRRQVVNPTSASSRNVPWTSSRLEVDLLSERQTRLAQLVEGRRLRAEPDVLPFDHVSCSCLLVGACECRRALGAEEHDAMAGGAACLGRRRLELDRAAHAGAGECVGEERARDPGRLEARLAEAGERSSRTG